MAIKCDMCGVESQVEEAFYTIQHSYNSRVGKRCPACWMKAHADGFRTSLITYGALIAFGVLLVILNSENSFGWFLLNFILYYICMVLAAVPHEFGHALVAKALGFRVFLVVIGFGRVMWERRVLGFRFQLKSIPFGGYAFATAKDTNWSRSKLFLFILAGPLANILLAGTLLLTIPDISFDFTGGIRPVAAFFIANLMCCAYSLWPRMVKTEHGDVPNDGLLMWKALFVNKETVRDVPIAYYYYEGAEYAGKRQFSDARKWFEKGLSIYPENFLLQNARAGSLLYLKEFRLARGEFLRLNKQTSPSAFQRIHLANSIAYADVLIGDSELLPEADAYSKEALASMPFVGYLKGTRGAVLVELGQIEEGINLLRQAMQQADLPASKALDACHIAMAEWRRGDHEECRKYGEVARTLDPECILLERLPV